MIYHSNLQELELQLSSTQALLEDYKQHQSAAPPAQKDYWDKHVTDSEKEIEKIIEMIKARKSVAYYDIPIKDLYKHAWTKPSHDNPGVALYEGDVFGIEIEYEGVSLNCNPTLYWKANPEHSLRAYMGHPPIEYALIKPLSREGLSEALTYLEKKMAQGGATPVPSPRTSVHIHLNAQYLTWKQVVTWFVTYALVEDILVEFSGKERVGNLFCLRARDTQYFVHCLEEAIKADKYSYVTDSEYRYTSMNLASIYKFGSVEFRSMRSPISMADITRWTDILLAIKNASLTFNNPIEVSEFFEAEGPKKMLKRIFPVKWMYDLFDHSNLSDIMWSAIREVKDVAYASNWQAKKSKARRKETPSVKEPVTAFFDTPNDFNQFAAYTLDDDD